MFLPKAEGVQTVTVRARSPEYGGYDPAEVVVKQGEKIRLMLFAEDIVHGFGISGYNIDVELHPGKWYEVEFTAENVGEFPFLCMYYCSPQHGLMRGKLRVIATS